MLPKHSVAALQLNDTAWYHGVAALQPAAQPRARRARFVPLSLSLCLSVSLSLCLSLALSLSLSFSLSFSPSLSLSA